MATSRVLSVGQCGLDHPAISRVIQQHFGAQVDGVPTAEAALDRLREGKYALVLVNRIFDADGDSGLELIRQVKADPELQPTPIMLVSNYPQYQEEARQAGAVPGFGKNALGQPAMLDALRPFLAG
jgi:two-component system chemotaxis response regulator CheY